MQPIRKFRDAQTIALLVANGMGACLYVFAASRGGWAIPEERAAGINSTTGEPFIWFSSIFPVVAVFAVVNAVWLLGVARRQWAGVRIWLLAASLWLPAIIVDFAHH